MDLRKQYPIWHKNRALAKKVMDEFARLDMYGKIAAAHYGLLLLTTDDPEDIFDISNLLEVDMILLPKKVDEKKKIWLLEIIEPHKDPYFKYMELDLLFSSIAVELCEFDLARFRAYGQAIHFIKKNDAAMLLKITSDFIQQSINSLPESIHKKHSDNLKLNKEMEKMADRDVKRIFARR